MAICNSCERCCNILDSYLIMSISFVHLSGSSSIRLHICENYKQIDGDKNIVFYLLDEICCSFPITIFVCVMFATLRLWPRCLQGKADVSSRLQYERAVCLVAGHAAFVRLVTCFCVYR